MTDVATLLARLEKTEVVPRLRTVLKGRIKADARIRKT
jgi:hypothetical protein